MNIEALRNRKIAVLGFGMEGQAVLIWLIKHDLTAVIFDQRPFAEWDNQAQLLCTEAQIQTITGPEYLEELIGFDIAFRSPGIWRNNQMLLDAEKKGLVITSQVKLFFQACPALIVGVTGTKGKGTTASLIYSIIKSGLANNEIATNSPLTSEANVYLTGNIGSVQPLDILDQLSSKDVIVYELSSFQLQDLNMSPQYSVVLMITQDHLDQHESLSEYHEAKQSIVAYQRPQDFAVINTDYPASKKFLTLTPAEKATISHENSVAKGCYISSDAKIFVHGLGVDDTSPFLNQSELLLRGVHNLQNISASIAIGLRLGISPESLKNSVRSFKGLEHRLELVGQFGGVSFYNDSFATVPETTIAALEAFTEPLILIVGGSEKHSDFTELGQTIVNKQNLKSLIVIGESGPRIIEAINKAGQTTAKIFTDAQTIDEIFAQIKETASVGDVVLLSPACASFGMFANYKDRGYKFKNLSKSFGGQA